MSFSVFSRFFSASVLLLLLIANGRAEPASRSPSPWIELPSDLPADPAVRWGTLANGLRYAIRPNAEPKDRVTLRLLVGAGSLQERDDERGLAHFIEHMLFRGTRAYPHDSLTSTLERLGVGLGPDNTAFTNLDYTIYHLELPDTREATLRQGLQVFREYAENATFEPELIERERGVILSEKATRNTPEHRESNANFEFIWPHSRIVERAPIGLEDNIRHFTREQFVAFYDAWYRPERMAVIVVGNVTQEAGARLVEEVFASLAPRAPAREDPTDCIPETATTSDVRVFLDPAIIGVGLTFEHPRKLGLLPDTHEQRVLNLNLSLAFSIFQQRLNRVTQDTGSGVVTPTASVGTPVSTWQMASISASGSINNWRQLMTHIEQEHRRAFLHGFTEAELVRAKTAFTASVEAAVRSTPTRRSEWYAADLASTLLYGRHSPTPEVAQQDLADALSRATTQDCVRAFRAAWESKPPHVFVVSNPSFLITPDLIALVLNMSRKNEVAAPPETTPVEFGYTDFGPAGKLTGEQNLPDLDARLSRFENGVRLNFKSTQFEADRVQVLVRLGSGKLIQPRDRPGLDLLANSALIEGGLGKHSATELSEIFFGRNLHLWFRIGSDASEFVAQCSRRDLLPALRLLTAYLTDAGYRPESLRDAHAAFGTMLSSYASQPGGPIGMTAESILTSGDPRFGVPRTGLLFARTLQELKGWLQPQFEHAPIELSIVGDTTWDESVEAVSRTLGALLKRADLKDTAPDPKSKLARPAAETITAVTSPQLKQSALAWYWSVPDASDVRLERRCNLLAAALAERIRIRLREEMGTAYSPTAGFVQHPGFPTFNYFVMYAEVDPARSVEAAAVMREEIDRLRANGFTDDEFTRVKTPFLRAREDDLRQNSYWGYTVLGDVQQHPERILAARNRSTDTSSITRAEIEKILRRYIDRKKAFFFVTAPTPPRAWPTK
jgi:zinc protease